MREPSPEGRTKSAGDDLKICDEEAGEPSYLPRQRRRYSSTDVEPVEASIANSAGGSTEGTWVAEATDGVEVREGMAVRVRIER